MLLICCASPKGGVGRTTLAANGAGESARAGHRIVARDLDAQNSLRSYFGPSLLTIARYAADQPQQSCWRDSLGQAPFGAELQDVAARPVRANSMASSPSPMAATMRQAQAAP
jgi:cellulose biosynthesis protein BcsQ